MVRIEYSKFFLAGTLAGLSVRCGFEVPKEDAVARSMEFTRWARSLHDTPAKESGGTYRVYNIGSTEVTA